jgi:hypothetical protein
MLPDVGIPHYPVGTAVAVHPASVNPRLHFLLLLESFSKISKKWKEYLNGYHCFQAG